MWSRFCWEARKKEGERRADGIVVLFAWGFTQERRLKPYIDLYSSLGWDCLLCHTDFLTQFFSEKATEIAFGIVGELIKEVKNRPLPVVFAVFSAGSKACFYKVLQLVQGKFGGQINQGDDPLPQTQNQETQSSEDQRLRARRLGESWDDYLLLRECIYGQIYDSSPIDVTNDLGLKFVVHPSVLKMPYCSVVVSWIAKTFSSGFDALFLNSSEAQRTEYWQTLYSSISMGPFIILCSEDDQVVPYQTLESFAQRLQELGADVNLIKWSSSPHVDHYRHHKCEYKAAVSTLLAKSSLIFKNRQLKKVADCKIPKSVCYLQDAAFNSNESLLRVAIGPSDHFYLPSSKEFTETKTDGSLNDEKTPELFHLPTIKPQGVLSQVLFDVCVPKNIEGWDIKPVSSLNKNRAFSSVPQHIRRSRL